MVLKPRKGCFIMSIPSASSVFDDIMDGSPYDYTMSDDNTIATNGYTVDGYSGTMSVEIIVHDDSDDPYYGVTIGIEYEDHGSRSYYRDCSSVDDVISMVNEYFPFD